MDYKAKYEELQTILNKQKQKLKDKYEKNKEKVKGESLAYYHANRDEINKRRRETRAAIRAALDNNTPALSENATV